MKSTTNGNRVVHGELLPSANNPLTKVTKPSDIVKLPRVGDDVRSIVRENTEAIRNSLQQITEAIKGTNFRVSIEEEINIIERD